MGRRLLRWFLWSVLISLFPYGGLAVLRLINQLQWPDLADLLGSGQLFLTSIALLAGGARELSGMETSRRGKTRDFLMVSTLIFCAGLALFYGSVANETINGMPPTSRQASLIALLSLGLLVPSLLITAGAIGVATPAGTEAQK